MVENRAVSTTSDVEHAIIEAVKPFNNLVLVYLFGSFASGRPHAFSDVDVAIYFREFSMAEFMKVHGALSRALGAQVDTIPLNIAPPLLRYEILKKGKRLISKDETIRIAYESRAILEGLDERPLIEAIREANLRRVLI
ncbi:MAG: nucleotidyltransferase domain-containing protein [Promethearchaeati archaeon SRVP18_Atabeyarchaeia-1]